MPTLRIGYPTGVSAARIAERGAQPDPNEQEPDRATHAPDGAARTDQGVLCDVRVAAHSLRLGVVVSAGDPLGDQHVQQLPVHLGPSHLTTRFRNSPTI